MAVSINKAIDQWKKPAKKLGNQAMNESVSAGKQYVKEMNPYYENTAKQLISSASQSKNRLNQDYQSAYDLNAVRQLISQRQLKEQMANAGLSDSGLNRSQQTALATSKANADAAIDRNKLAANVDIESQLQNNLSTNENNKIMQNAQAMWQARQSGLSAKQGYLQNAFGYGANTYNNEQQIEATAKENEKSREFTAEQNKASLQAEYDKAMLSSSNSNTSDKALSENDKKKLKSFVTEMGDIPNSAELENYIRGMAPSQQQQASDWVANYAKIVRRRH